MNLVGAAILGYPANEVEYLTNYAKRHGNNLEFTDYDWGWTEEDTVEL